jgi:hypothetical protein
MAEQPIGITFSAELQKQMFGSDKVDFPIDFDDAWTWLGYSSKQQCLALLAGRLSSDYDYQLVPCKVSEMAAFFGGIDAAIELRAAARTVLQSWEERPLTRINEGTHKGWADALAAHFNGKVEVRCPEGRIDVLTDDYVIEVKPTFDYGDGAQVRRYQHYYPDRVSVVFYFKDHWHEGMNASANREVLQWFPADVDCAPVEAAPDYAGTLAMWLSEYQIKLSLDGIKALAFLSPQRESVREAVRSALIQAEGTTNA